MKHAVTRAPFVLCTFLVASVLTGLAQEPPGNARVRALGDGILQTLEWLETRTGGQDAARAEGTGLLLQRARALAALAEENPTATLQLAFPGSLVARLANAFPAAAPQLDANGSWEGPLEYIIEDGPDFTTHPDIRTITVRGERLSVQFAGPEPAGLENGDLVRVTGVRSHARLTAAMRQPWKITERSVLSARLPEAEIPDET